MSIKEDKVIITSEGETKEESKLFNSSGQINAQSLKDALAALVKYAKLLEEGEKNSEKKDE